MTYRRATVRFRGSLVAAVAAMVAAGMSFRTAPAQVPHITTDGTMGASVSFTGRNAVIPSTLGTRRGGNLFHSFGRFNIPTDYTASFTDPTGSAISNVISRVTGSGVTTIDGKLASTILNSDFYFINPAGIVLGPNASIDVPGSFHISTADTILFPDGEFSATSPANAVLSAAPPQAFGFLDDGPAPVSIRGSSLEIPEGKTFSIVGGAIRIEGGEDASITAEGGTVVLVSVASAGTVAIGSDPGAGSFAKWGDITLVGPKEQESDSDDSNDSDDTDDTDDTGSVDDAPDPNIDVSGDQGGRVVIRAGNLWSDSFSIAANTDGDADGAPVAIDIGVSGTVVLSGESQFASITGGNGRGGDVVVSADRLIMREEGEILSDTDAGGRGGRVVIAAGVVSLSGDAEIASDVDEGASGAGGSVTITADRIVLGGDSEISSDTGGSGAGGTVSLTASSLVQLGDRASIVTDSKETGDAGSIFIDAGDRFVSRGGVIATSADTADGGNITLNAESLIFLADSAITTSVGNGAGNGGNIAIDPDFVVMDSSVIQANAFGGNGGNISIVAGQFLASPDSVVEASSALGIDGNIEIDAPDTDVAGALAVLPANLADSASQLARQCSARGGRTLASFVGTGRGGLPARPGGPVSAYYFSGRAGAAAADIRPATSPAFETGDIDGAGHQTESAERNREVAMLSGTMALSCGDAHGSRAD